MAKNLKQLSLDQIKILLKKEEKALKKEYSELVEKKKLIERYKKIRKARQKVRGKITIKKSKPKTFQEYFNECIKNREIPEDTPPHFRKALEKVLKQYKSKIIKTKSAMGNSIKQYQIEGEPNLTPNQFFNKNKKKIIKFLRNNKNKKVNFVLLCNFLQPLYDQKGFVGHREVDDYFSTKTKKVLESTNVDNIVEGYIDKINLDIDNYQQNGSGWAFLNIKKLEINLADYSPTKGSSYIDLPKWIKLKKAIINPKNKDDKCFLWCILRYLHPKTRDSERIADLRKYEDELVTKGLTFPMDVKDIKKFEKLNPEIPSILVLAVEGKSFQIIKSPKDSKDSINLFLIKDGDRSHYTLIKNLSRLIRSSLTTNRVGGFFICKRCLCHFNVERKFDLHVKYCNNNKAVRVKMPAKGEFIKFNNNKKYSFEVRQVNRKYPIPFVIYADFECFTRPIDSHSPDESIPYSIEYQKHEPSGFCFYIKGITDNFKPVCFTKQKENDDVAAIFIKKIGEYTQLIYDKYYKKPKKMFLSPEEEISFSEAKYCSICEEELGSERVHDHCHITGKYRGAAHKSCNINCRLPRIIPVIFHNLQSYDAHLFIKKIGNLKGTFKCIPNTEEKYMSFSKIITVGSYITREKNKEGIYIEKIKNINFEIRFIDSLKFLNSSLEQLVKNLKKKDEDEDEDEYFYNIKQEFKHNTNLVTKKGVYPYDYVTDLSKLTENELPPKGAFYSKLKDEEISEEDYNHAIRVWDSFNCKTIRDYHDLYLKTDVLLLADVFEKFRVTCMEHYKLDPAYYYTIPHLAWFACLKETGQQLELLHDYDMLMFFERGIRGGMTHISKRYAEANNPYMKSYNPEKSIKYIQYLDANNLYGWAMSQSLPTHGFKWVKYITKEKVYDILEKEPSSRGYVFEVDLDYPKKLWTLHNDYPLAPEPTEVDGVEKLIGHFIPKKEYVVHYQNLKQYLKMGLELKAVHRAISFKQSPWMKPYIDKNTKLRMKAKNDFEKDFFKLMINSVFGKTIENLRKRQSIKIVDNRKDALKEIKKPNFERAVIFDKRLVACHMQKTEIYFNKPIYVGQAILDLSKTLMFDFHYNYIKPKYGSKAKLLFTDTDSLMYEIRTKDFYKDITPDIEAKFDTSAYPPNHKSGIPTGLNKKVIGMFKDEVAGNQITHFIGLRPKLYSYKVEEKKEPTKKCKGITKSVIKKGITFNDYYDCLFTGEKQMRTMKVIQSKNHDIYSKEVNKIALSCEDNKRLVLEDKIHTKAIRPN